MEPTDNAYWEPHVTALVKAWEKLDKSLAAVMAQLKKEGALGLKAGVTEHLCIISIYVSKLTPPTKLGS